MVELLRQKSSLIVVFDACARISGISGLANFWTRDVIFQRAYKEFEKKLQKLIRR